MSDAATAHADGRVEVDPAALRGRDGYKLLVGTILPRPIAFLTTRSAAGVLNAAPFSFFNGVASDPLILAVGIGPRPDGRPKDSAQNIAETGEFVVNLVDRALVDAMNICALALEPEEEETVAAGLQTVPSSVVGPPRLADAPAAFECTRHTVVEVGRGHNIVLGQVVRVHYRAGIYDVATGRIDLTALDPVSRLSGDAYGSLDGLFDLPRPDLAAWRAAQAEGKSA